MLDAAADQGLADFQKRSHNRTAWFALAIETVSFFEERKKDKGESAAAGNAQKINNWFRVKVQGLNLWRTPNTKSLSK
jgi:hypothetical protein